MFRLGVHMESRPYSCHSELLYIDTIYAGNVQMNFIYKSLLQKKKKVLKTSK